jgi:hypothetical protein
VVRRGVDPQKWHFPEEGIEGIESGELEVISENKNGRRFGVARLLFQMWIKRLLSGSSGTAS